MKKLLTTLVIALLVMTAQAADPFLGCVLGKTTKSDAKLLLFSAGYSVEESESGSLMVSGELNVAGIDFDFASLRFGKTLRSIDYCAIGNESMTYYTECRDKLSAIYGEGTRLFQPGAILTIWEDGAVKITIMRMRGDEEHSPAFVLIYSLAE